MVETGCGLRVACCELRVIRNLKLGAPWPFNRQFYPVKFIPMKSGADLTGATIINRQSMLGERDV